MSYSRILVLIETPYDKTYIPSVEKKKPLLLCYSVSEISEMKLQQAPPWHFCLGRPGVIVDVTFSNVLEQGAPHPSFFFVFMSMKCYSSATFLFLNHVQIRLEIF